MAKKANKEKVLAATMKRVAACKICNGNPKLTSFNIPEYQGTKCDECFEIINYDDKIVSKTPSNTGDVQKGKVT